MKIVHISDTHTKHAKISVPPCDMLIHSGDIGSRTNTKELVDFLVWLEAQPATHKIWTAGNHDVCLDSQFMRENHPVGGAFGFQQYKEALAITAHYGVRYLHNEACTIDGLSIYGAPWSPSFHRASWAFNQTGERKSGNNGLKSPQMLSFLLPIRHLLTCWIWFRAGGCLFPKKPKMWVAKTCGKSSKKGWCI